MRWNALEGRKMIIIDYVLAKECKNKEAYYICYKCGECGRVFNEEGFMIDDGGTHEEDCID